MYDFDGSFDSIIKELKLLQDQHRGHVLNIDAYSEPIPYEDDDRVVFEVFYEDKKELANG